MKNLNDYFTWPTVALVAFAGGYLAQETLLRSQIPISRAATAPVATIDSHRVSPSEAQRAVAFCRKTIESGIASDLARFLASLETIHPDDREYLLSLLVNATHEDPDKYGALVQDVSIAFYRQDPKKAFSFLESFSRSKPIVDVERYLLKEALKTDSKAIQVYLQDRLEEDLILNPGHLEQLASIYGNERKENSREWTDWLTSLDPEKDWDLYRNGLISMARHAAPKDREKLLSNLKDLAIESERMWDGPSELIASQTLDEPEKAAAALIDLPAGPWKDYALEEFLYVAGGHHPQHGIDLMSDPHFLENFHHGWTYQNNHLVFAESAKTSQEQFFDTALQILLSTALRSDPEAVLKSAPSFYDRELQTSYQEVAEGLVSGAADQFAFKNEDHECGPGCKH